MPLKHPIHITADVEVWLSHLADEMKDTLRQLLFECLDAGQGGQSVDPRMFPSQVT